MRIEKLGIFEAKTHLSEIIDKVEKGQVFQITRRGKLVAEIRSPAPLKKPLDSGFLKNDAFWMADDFDDTPDDFDPYL